VSKPILLVDDEEHDVLFMQIALEEARVTNQLCVVRDGQEALRYLKAEGDFADRGKFPLPGLVLLDLRLPRVPGLEVLKWIRDQEAFRHLPVIICSSSGQDSDVEAAYRLGADGYVVKPSRISERLDIVRKIKKYWLDQDGPPPDCQDWLSTIVPRPEAHPPAV
jgi:CheY-like chemotaxis protein